MDTMSPRVARREKVSCIRDAINDSLRRKMMYTDRIANTPINPNSSLYTAKIKSVVASGKKFS